nr:hypothetical protein [Chromobacterium sp. ASV5]
MFEKTDFSLFSGRETVKNCRPPPRAPRRGSRRRKESALCRRRYLMWRMFAPITLSANVLHFEPFFAAIFADTSFTARWFLDSTT